MSKKTKFKKKDLESYGATTFTELVSQIGGADNLADLVPHDVIDAKSLTIENLFQFIREFDSLCVIGVNTHD